MPFPEKKRVIYNKNPLEQVICQVRFPPILKIDVEIPAQFQEMIRKEFPIYSETTELRLEIPHALKAQMPPDTLNQVVQNSGKNYEFSSEDNAWKINLTKGFVALTANKYTRWEEFRAKLTPVLKNLIDIYSPDYFSRVGLRYVDLIKRSVLGLQDVEWGELLQPYILGILGSNNVSKNVKDMESRNELLLSDNQSIVRIIIRLVETDNGEICFLIDSDFFNTEKTSIKTVFEKLDFFNARGSRLIQWCITDRLHNAMEPENL
jgi:uncharacterized protein (TIGR04255 family)